MKLSLFCLSLLAIVGCSSLQSTNDRGPATTESNNGNVGTGNVGDSRSCAFTVSGIEDKRVLKLISRKMGNNGYTLSQGNALLSLVIKTAEGTGVGSGAMNATGISSVDFYKPMTTSRIKVVLKYGNDDSRILAMGASDVKSGVFPVTLSDALDEALDKISKCPAIF